MRALAALVILLSAPASAASYYASTSGSGSACSLASPCTITQAQTNMRAAIAGGMNRGRCG